MRDEVYLGIGKIAKRLGLSAPLVRSWITSGRITATKDGDGECAAWMSTERLIRADLKRLGREIARNRPVYIEK